MKTKKLKGYKFYVRACAKIFVHLGAESALKICVRVRACVKQFFGADVRHTSAG